MAARRFLIAIAVLIVLAVVGVVAYRALAPMLMRAAFVPNVSFAESPKPPAAFYNRPDAWLARPGIPSQNVRWTPDGFAPAPKPAVAVFYVHPTTYLKGDRWNAPFDVDEGAAFRQGIFLRSQASVFNGVGEIWAPKYRQATFGAFLSLGKADAAQAFALAYSDVAAAFDMFLRQIPPNQKIILAGHSQGSLHLLSLLAGRIAGTPVADRIVAAYLIGWPISIEADLPSLGLPACESPEQTRCIISYQSYAEPADTDAIFKPFGSTLGLTGEPRKDTHLLCVNPLAGMTEHAAPDTAEAEAADDGNAMALSPEDAADDDAGPNVHSPERNLGTLIPIDEEYTAARLDPARVGAHCTDTGYLSIGDQPPREFRAYVLPGNNYHVYDYALFWTNLRADVERRTHAALTGTRK